jgi:hypothetical protein
MNCALAARSIAERTIGAPGRPTVLSDTRAIELLLTETAAGVHLEPACAIAGLHSGTVRRWLQAAEQEQAQTPGQNLTEGSAIRLFSNAYKACKAEVEAQITRNVIKASAIPAFWASGVTYLERTAPERWSRPSDRVERGTAAIEVHVHGIDRGQVTIGIASLSPIQTPAQSEGIDNHSAIALESDNGSYVTPLTVREITAYSEHVGSSGAAGPTGAPPGAAAASGPSTTNTQRAILDRATASDGAVQVTEGRVDVPYLIEGLPGDPTFNPAADRRRRLLHALGQQQRKQKKKKKQLANAVAYNKRRAAATAITTKVEKGTVSHEAVD